MKINDEGRSNAAYWYERAMKAEACLALGHAWAELSPRKHCLRCGADYATPEAHL